MEKSPSDRGRGWGLKAGPSSVGLRSGGMGWDWFSWVGLPALSFPLHLTLSWRWATREGGGERASELLPLPS